ncbi:MAG: glycosyltransferase [Candidatus Omnitrophota bacterium]
MEKKITVIIPIYNSEKTIEECLNHLFSVKYSNFDVVVVNDVSTDSSIGIIEKFPCKIVNLIETRGPGFARDKGLEFAEGEIVAFLDADCLVPEDWLLKINAKMVPEIIGIGGKYDLPNNFNWFYKIFLTFWDLKNILYKKAGKILTFSGGNCAFWKTALLRRRKKKELAFCNGIAGGEDTIMCCELSKLGKLIYDPGLRVIHIKKCSFREIFWKTIKSGYTGAIVSKVVGKFLIKEPDRAYKTLIYLFSIFIFLSLLFHFRIYPWIVLVYLIIQLPMIMLAHKELSIGLYIIFFPLIVFIADIFHFIGHIKRLSVSLGGLIKNVIWCLRLALNIINPRAVSKIFFFTTKECNAKCYFCFNKNNEEAYQQHPDLSLAEVTKITKGIGFLPILTITGGEPFLRNDFLEICKLFYFNCGTRFISIATNGTESSRINDTVEELLIDCRHLRLTIIVALDDIGERHDKIKGRKNCYLDAVNTLERLGDLKYRFPRLTLSINTMLLKENSSNIDYILNYFSDHLDYDRQALNLLRQPPRSDYAPDLIKPQDYFRLMQKTNRKVIKRLPVFKQRINLAFWEYCYLKILKESELKKPLSTCVAAKKFFVINNNGDIYSCELLTEAIANLREEDFNFKKIAKSERVKRIRLRIKDTRCYCQWPCSAVCNILFNPISYIGLFKRIVFANQLIL